MISNFAKLRISNYNLEIEWGCYKKKKKKKKKKNIPASQRFCKTCNNASVEDEFQFVVNMLSLLAIKTHVCQ